MKLVGSCNGYYSLHFMMLMILFFVSHDTHMVSDCIHFFPVFFCGLATSDTTTMTFRVFFLELLCNLISIYIYIYIYIYVDVGLDTVGPTLYTTSRISLHLCVR
jgi:hypothetical protein